MNRTEKYFVFVVKSGEKWIEKTEIVFSNKMAAIELILVFSFVLLCVIFAAIFFITSYSKEEEEKTNKLSTQFERILRPFCVSLFRFVCSSSTLLRSLTCSIDMECSGVVQKG